MASKTEPRYRLSQPLFRFSGRLINEEPITQANNNVLSARRRLESQRRDLIVEVVREYVNILRLELQLKADNKSFSRTKELYDNTYAKEVIGRATRVDTLRVELQMGQAQSRVEGSLERLQSAKSSFSELLDINTESDFTLEPYNLLEIEIPDRDILLNTALENRLDYAQALQDLEDAKRGALIAEKQLQPDLQLIARYTYLDNQSSSVTTIDEPNQWFIGLSAGTVFNRTREKIRVEQADIEKNSSEQLINILQQSISRQIQQAILTYRRTNADLKILERNLEHALARLELAQRLFEIGRGDNFSVTDAEEAFVEAESRLYQGRADTLVSSYSLLRTIGTLTETPNELK